MNVGQQQQEEYLRANESLLVADYLPPASQIAYLMSFPAWVICDFVRYFLDIAASAYWFWFISGAGLLWFVIGTKLDRKVADQNVKPEFYGDLGLRVGILLASIVGVIQTGLLHPMLGIGGLVWSGISIMLVGRKLGVGRKLSPG